MYYQGRRRQGEEDMEEVTEEPGQRERLCGGFQYILRVQHIGVSRLWKAREEEGCWLHSRLLWSLDFSGLSESLTEKDPFIIPPSPPQTDVASSRCQDCMLHEARSCMCCLVPWCILIWKSTSKPFQKKSGKNSLNLAFGISQKRALGYAGEEILYFSLFIFCDTEQSSFCREAAQPNSLQ